MVDENLILTEIENNDHLILKIIEGFLFCNNVFPL